MISALKNQSRQRIEPGTVCFVGAGPGAPDLLTARAIGLLQSADVVLHDALGTEAVLPAYCGHALCVPVGKRAGRASAEQTFINRALIEYAGNMHRVARLKGGDPVVFGRLDEEIATLERAGIRYSVTPGITAASAAAAASGIPLTRRGSARSLSIVTPAVQAGDQSDDAWTDACPPGATVAVYMSGRALRQTARQLSDCGHAPTTPVRIAYAVSTDEEQFHTTTLGHLLMGVGESSINPLAFRPDERPCVLLVGAVAAEGNHGSGQSPAATPPGTASCAAQRTIA